MKKVSCNFCCMYWCVVFLEDELFLNLSCMFLKSWHSVGFENFSICCTSDRANQWDNGAQTNPRKTAPKHSFRTLLHGRSNAVLVKFFNRFSPNLTPPRGLKLRESGFIRQKHFLPGFHS